MLTDSGHPDAADALRRAVLESGGDLGTVRFLPGATEAAEAAELLALFEAGTATVGMIERYLALMDRAGRPERIAPFFAAEAFGLYDLTHRETDCPTTVDVAAAAAAVAASVGPGTWREASQASTRIHRVNLLPPLTDNPAIAALITAVRERVLAYRARRRAAGRPGAEWIPAAIDLRGWCIVNEGCGSVGAHTHNDGWVTCVAYLEAPRDMLAAPDRGGWLHIGPPGNARSADGWPDLRIAPKPGRLVVMPSYATHEVPATTVPGLRISAALDVVEVR